MVVEFGVIELAGEVQAVGEIRNNFEVDVFIRTGLVLRSRERAFIAGYQGLEAK